MHWLIGLDKETCPFTANHFTSSFESSVCGSTYDPEVLCVVQLSCLLLVSLLQLEQIFLAQLLWEQPGLAFQARHRWKFLELQREVSSSCGKKKNRRSRLVGTGSLHRSHGITYNSGIWSRSPLGTLPIHFS